MLEALINVKLAMRKKEPKSEVKKKFIEYTKAYDNADKNIGDKIRHRDIFLSYIKYIGNSENQNI